MSESRSHDDRMLQLLADRATEGIGMTDAEALDEWLARDTDIDAEAFERAVALTKTPVDAEALPALLRGKLVADAGVFFGWNHER